MYNFVHVEGGRHTTSCHQWLLVSVLETHKGITVAIHAGIPFKQLQIQIQPIKTAPLDTISDCIDSEFPRTGNKYNTVISPEPIDK